MQKFEKIRGAAFDLDGVLADTAKFHTQAWRELAEKVGVKWTDQLQEALKGVGRMDSLEMILAAGNIENTYSDEQKRALEEAKNQRYQNLVNQLTPDDVLPGMHQLLDDLRVAGIKMSVASASKNAPMILERLGLLGYFEGIVDPAEVQAGKPDPAIFSKAAELLHLPPEVVIGFEDAQAGIQSIRSAGELAVGIGVPGDITFENTHDVTLAALKEKI
ncbi:beta-phosphoglucomutase [Weissella uvarum]|uniref:beta-phosphoglucomutase n=1 Tax=Weissella uvarum TaxID=1479233 RepID=UPI001961C3E3|nr:beta-phosphoglucomutase [Weissella uvarum]MBM7616548.1 beta-phosphoglucomutase [Weissella uvarum]MCM0594992.1 beta-phosphoglucomutase [Weissella uvarum]